MNSLYIITSMLLISAAMSAQTVATQSGASFSSNGILTEIEYVSDKIVHVHKTPAGEDYRMQSQVVIKTPERMSLKSAVRQDQVILNSSSVRLEANTVTGGISFYDSAGMLMMTDKDCGASFAPKDDAGQPSYQIRNAFVLDKDEPIYGLGQILDGKLNRRRSVHHLQNENTFTCSPYVFSPTKRYALYWDNYSISDFSDSDQEMAFTSLGHCIDYYLIYGDSTDDVIAQMRDLTGKAPMLPLWAYGYFQSKDRYQNADETVNVLRKYREIGVPIDVVIQDWRYWPEHHKTDSAWNSQTFDPAIFPDPVKWVDEIHSMNGKLMISNWPGFGPQTAQYKELDAKGLMLDFYTWPPYSGAKPYDVYSSEARDIYWKYMSRGIYDYVGNDGWWLDSTEPDHIITSIYKDKDEDFNVSTSMGSYRSVKNIYSLMHNSGVATHQKATGDGKRVVILTRSGFVGQQRYGSNTWSGDVQSTWDMLQKQIPAALNFSMMGIPNWNSDIGGYNGYGYSPAGAKDPAYQELFVRWMQFGTFSPIMRAHGKRIPREIWNFGEKGTWCFDAIEKCIKLRYRLLPYIYSTSWDVSHNDGLFMRALVLDYPEDKATYNLGGQFLFGKSLMISPVTESGVKQWNVYLPGGNGWWDFWTDEKVRGGQEISVPVTMDKCPIYVKEGTILPFGPEVQYSTEKPWDNLEIRVYPGADGSFVLYEDENDNYNYERGIYSTIAFEWNESSHTLSIGQREGEFPGMLAKRRFKIVLVSENAAGGDVPMAASKTVSYNGKRLVVKL